MAVSAKKRELVRTRANFACEYCGVREDDAGGMLTIDHFYPKSRGGNDDISNLIYCCSQCNVFKSDYAPSPETPTLLWNPLTEPLSNHALLLADGKLYPITPIGTLTIDQLHLNRSHLIRYRKRNLDNAALDRFFPRLGQLLVVMENLYRDQATMKDQQRSLLQLQLMLVALRAQQDKEE